MVAELALPLPRRVTVFVYPSRAAYAEGLARSGGTSDERAAALAESSVALGQRDRLFLNDGALRGAPRRAWLAVVAHELTHVAQLELSGGRRGRSEQWLREGMADWVAARVLERLGEDTRARRRERALGAVARLPPALRDGALDLIDLGRPPGWEARRLGPWGRATYPLAFLLADELVRRSGLDGLVAYFRAFAGPDDRLGHFERAFGLSLPDFERRALDRLRGEVAALQAAPVSGPLPAPGAWQEAQVPGGPDEAADLDW